MTPITYHMPTAEEMYGGEIRRLHRLEEQYFDIKESFYGPQERKNRFAIKAINSKDGIS